VIGGRPATDAVIPGRHAVSVGNPASPLPPGWGWMLLSDIAELGTGHTPSRKHPEYWDGDIPWVGIRDAGDHHSAVIMDTAQHVNELGLANSAARLLPTGTVCLSRTASVGYVVMMGRPMATSQDFVTWSCGNLLDPRYLMNALLAEGDDIRRFGKGSTHTTIYLPVPHRPLAEQAAHRREDRQSIGEIQTRPRPPRPHPPAGGEKQAIYLVRRSPRPKGLLYVWMTSRFQTLQSGTA
jgi:type I restriction enzyme, S subunit